MGTTNILRSVGLACTGAALLAARTSPAGAQETTCMSVSSGGQVGDAESIRAVITPDGRYVAFMGSSSNLVPGDTNGALDVFLRERQTGTN